MSFLELKGSTILSSGVNLTHGTPNGPLPALVESGDVWNDWDGSAVTHIVPLITESSIETVTPNDVWMSWDTSTTTHLTPLPTTSGIYIPTAMDAWMFWDGS